MIELYICKIKLWIFFGDLRVGLKLKQIRDLCLGYSGDGGTLSNIKRNSSRQEEGRKRDIRHINMFFYVPHKKNIYEFFLYKISSINSGGHKIQTTILYIYFSVHLQNIRKWFQNICVFQYFVTCKVKWLHSFDRVKQICEMNNLCLIRSPQLRF